MRIKLKQIDDVNYAQISLSEVNEVDLKSIEEDSLLFNIKTYKYLKSKETNKDTKMSSEEGWVLVYKPINIFLNSQLSNHEKLRLARIFSEANKGLYGIETVDELPTVIQSISANINKYFTDLELTERLVDYVKYDSGVNVHINQVAGNSPHHSPDTTFDYEESVYCTVLSIVCKLFSPIFGQIVNFVSNTDIDNSMTELHAVGILKDYLDDHFPKLRDKLLHFIKVKGVEKFKVNDRDHTLSYKGKTNATLVLTGFSSILVRTFVNLDLYDKNPKNTIMSKVHSTATSLKPSAINSNRTARVSRRLSPAELNSNSESNHSLLEQESGFTSGTIEIPLLVKMITNSTIKEFIEQKGLDEEIYEKCCSFYRLNPFPMTPINAYIINTFMGHRIGGAHGIQCLYMEEYMKLVVITQMYMTKLLPNLHENAIHILSILNFGKKTELTIEDNQIEAMRGASYSYNNCKEMFSYSVGRISWDTALNEIIEYITTNVHVTNTPPKIWDMIDKESTNNKTLNYGSDILANIYDFIYHSLKTIQKELEEEI